MASSAACSGLKPFPTKTIYEIDLKDNTCGEYVLTDMENLKFKWIKDHPLNDCDGTFGFASQDIPKVLDWASDAIKACKGKCK